jgi:AraC family transcriptional regulator
MSGARILPLLAYLGRAARTGGDVSLAAMAARARGSRFELHRAFRRVARETPKQYALRLRLDRAAAELLRSRRGVLAIALAAGFDSHEVFTRAFRRRFGITPSAYRARGALHGPAALHRHAELVAATSPCVGVYRIPKETSAMTAKPSAAVPPIAIRELTPQPFLAIRRRVAPSEIAATLGEILPAVFGHAQRLAIPFAGPPTTRYVATGPGLLTMEAGMPISGKASSEGPIEALELPGGIAAVGVHAGAYDTLQATHVAVERWIEANGYAVAGAPWEVYTTDPGEFPDPADWRTDVVYPVRRV